MSTLNTSITEATTVRSRTLVSPEHLDRSPVPATEQLDFGGSMTTSGEFASFDRHKDHLPGLERPEGSDFHGRILRWDNSCTAWLQSFAQHILAKCGPQPVIRLRAYEVPGHSMLNLYISRSRMGFGIVITVIIGGSGLKLPPVTPRDDEFDVSVSSLSCALDFVSGLSAFTRGQSQWHGDIWIAQGVPDSVDMDSLEPTLIPEMDSSKRSVMASEDSSSAAGSGAVSNTPVRNAQLREVYRRTFESFEGGMLLTIPYFYDSYGYSHDPTFPTTREQVMALIDQAPEKGIDVVHVVCHTSYPTTGDEDDAFKVTDRFEAVRSASGRWRLQYVSCPHRISSGGHSVSPTSDDIIEYCDEVLEGDARVPRNVTINESMRSDGYGPLARLDTRRDNRFPIVSSPRDIELVRSILGDRNIEVVEGS